VITVKEEIAVPSPRARVWAVVSNPADVVSCISGAELGEAHEDGSFDGALVVRFGAIRVRFAARIALDLDEPEFEGRLTARGGDGQGATRFRGDATFRVVEDEAAGGSLVLMNGEVTLTGKLASLVESGAGVVISRMTKDFTAKLIAKCTAQEAAATAPPAGAGEAPVPAAAATPGAPAAAGATSAPAAAPRPGLLRRIGAALARVLFRRQPPPGEDRGAAASPSARTARDPQTEEIGSDHAPAQ
jgi:carbon monoxide dehydrogenase subunit G